VQAVRPFDLFAPGAASVLVLLSSRIGGLVLIAPVFSARTVPMRVRTVLVLIMTLLMQPVALSRAVAGAAVTPAAVLGETLVGFAIGLGAAVFVGAAEAAGELVATQSGMSGAALMDPLNHTQVPLLASFTQIFAVTLMLAFDAHLVMIDAVAASTRFAPVGSALDAAGGAKAMLSLGGMLFATGFRFAAPVIAAVMVTNVGLAVLSKAAPQMNILSVAFPLQIGVGLFALAATLPLIATHFGAWEGTYDALLTRLLGAFAPGALPAGGH
jgi:flagellar biosynthetic protein FliR